MLTVEIQVFEFSELSEKAKEKALNDFCSQDSYPFYSDAQASLQSFCDLFYIKIKDYNYGDCCRYNNWIKTDACNDSFRGLKIRQFNFDQMPTGYFMDSVLLEKFKQEWIATSSALLAFREALRTFITTINKEVEDYFSAKSLEEMSKANNWTYLPNGKLFNV